MLELKINKKNIHLIKL